MPGKQGKTIILASSSPRRRELMNGLGLKYIVDVPAIDEAIPAGVSPEKAVQSLALKKAQAVAEKYSEGLVIGADTVVVLDNKIMGKPADNEDALSMLLELQGRVHRVYTGVAVIDAMTGRTVCEKELTYVEFGPFNKEDALSYIATGEPLGKAGSYAIQGLGAILVKSVSGDYYNVVGLPLFLLAKVLRSFGVNIL